MEGVFHDDLETAVEGVGVDDANELADVVLGPLSAWIKLVALRRKRPVMSRAGLIGFDASRMSPSVAMDMIGALEEKD